jgi:hypothetical protein
VETVGLKQRIEMLEQENRRLSEVNEVVKRDIGDISGMKELLANLEAKHEKLRETVARHGDDLLETRRRNSELGGHVQQLEKENRRIRATSEGLKSQLARAEAGQQRVVAGLQEAIAAGGSKVTEKVTNLEQELAKLKWEIKWMKTEKQFSPSAKKRKLTVNVLGHGRTTIDVHPPSFFALNFPFHPVVNQRIVEIDVPDGIIAHLTRECSGNVHDRNVVEVTSGSFEKETYGANPHSGAFDNDPSFAAKNVADLETDLFFLSAYRTREKDIPHTWNNWICYHFKERRIVPTHYTIRTWRGNPGGHHLKSWVIETSTDGENWREVAHEEDNKQLNGKWFTATFAVAGGEECRFIRLVNIGRNHFGDDSLWISAWEIFGNLIE